MSKVIVKGGAPGFFRVELEGTNLAVDVTDTGNAYQTAHALKDFMQVLADAAPLTERSVAPKTEEYPAIVDEPPPKKGKSKLPPPPEDDAA